MSDAWDNLVQGLKDAFGEIGSIAGEWLPRILWALVVLIIGRWILRTLRTAIERLLDLPAVNAVFDRSGLTGALEPSGTKPAKLVGTVAYALLSLLLWLVVVRILQIDSIEDLLQRLIAVIPLIVVAVALVIIAAAVGNYVADLVRPYSEENEVAWLPTAVRIVILITGVLAALDLLEITFAENVILITTAALGVTFAVAFGIGGVDTARKWWNKYFAPREG
jgi:hypothetical protein